MERQGSMFLHGFSDLLANYHIYGIKSNCEINRDNYAERIRMGTIEGLKSAGGIYIKNIQDGFDSYDFEVVKMTLDDAYRKILSYYLINGYENSFVDFYYFKLKEEEKMKIETFLSGEELDYLKELQKEKFTLDEIIFSIDPTLLNITVKLNYYQALFSTFYFTKEPCTLWGNYNQEYVIFKNKLQKINS
jgi:hypothetical protein